jgi:SnoaL-like domain
VLVLRDVLGYSANETAGMIATSVPAANSALQRARATLDTHRISVGSAPVIPALGDVETRDLARRYTRAMQDADIDTVIGLLTADATWSMPPDATWYAGTEAIAAFLRDYPLRLRWRHLPTHANGQPAVMCYLLDDDETAFRAHALDVFDIARDGRIKWHHRVPDPGRAHPIPAPHDPARKLHTSRKRGRVHMTGINARTCHRTTGRRVRPNSASRPRPLPHSGSPLAATPYDTDYGAARIPFARANLTPPIGDIDSYRDQSFHFAVDAQSSSQRM